MKELAPEFGGETCYHLGIHMSSRTAELKDNNIWALVDDMENLRIYLGIDKWIVFGGSWGSTLGLTYAIKQPTSVKALILRGIFTLRKSEVDSLYQEGVSHIFPDYFDLYVGPIPIHVCDILLTTNVNRTRCEPAVWCFTYSHPDMIAKAEHLE
ncbi:hypothetical protein HDU99_001297 [Rhizoclosmatium hyalinum]|nr:hypothetical protein HDU99_001297 [Rhizoclosmatium hyalinum]